MIEHIHKVIEDSCKECDSEMYQIFFWTFGNPLEKVCVKIDEKTQMPTGIDYEPTNIKPPGFNPSADVCFILDEIEKMEIRSIEQKAIFILADVHKLISANPHDLAVTRRVKSLALNWESIKKRLFLLGQGVEIPQEFSELVEEIKIELPGVDEIKERSDETLDYLVENSGVELLLTPEEEENFIRSMQGFTLQAIAKNIRLGVRKYEGVADSRLIEFMQQRKIEKLEKLGVQFSPPPDVAIAGLDEFQDWIRGQTKLFGKAARRYNITPPKGAVLVGVSGTGKSLAAKTVGWEWKIPILSLNIGSVLQGIVGSSERNFREILAIAETVAPAILFIDELEKAFAGVGAGSLDSGVMDRIFGTFLTWMNDKTAPVFVVAAANKIQGLPPEFLRKGRFDEIWFVGLPNTEERIAILRNHCQKRQLEVSDFVLREAAIATDGYSGAELGAIIAEAQKVLFSQLTDEQLESEEFVPLVPSAKLLINLAKASKPLSEQRKGDIDEMTQWGKQNARMASRPLNQEETKPKRSSRTVQRNIGIDLN